MFSYDIALVWVVDEWWMVHNSRPAVFHPGNFRENVLGGLESGFLFYLLPTLFRRRGRGFFDEDLGIDVRVPHFQSSHVRVLAHVLTIGLRHGLHCVFAAASGEAKFARCQDDARCQSFKVPFPGCLKGLIEVIDVEQQPPLGAGKAPEIRYMAITASLGANPS